MKEYEIIKALDSVIAKHLIRLIGTDKGVNGLPLTLVTITALVLLWEKEQGSPDLTAPPERYTKEELMEEMEQLGLSISGPLAQEFQELFDKGYVYLGQEGMVVPLEPALKTARLLDVLFKGMPGMTLVAYMVQLFCEVIAGQKDVELAMTSVDTTLTNVGMLPEQRASKNEPPGHEASIERIEKEAVARAKVSPQEIPPPPEVKVEIDKVKEALRLWRQQKKRKAPKLITADGRAKIIASSKKRQEAPSAARQQPPPEEVKDQTAKVSPPLSRQKEPKQEELQPSAPVDEASQPDSAPPPASQPSEDEKPLAIQEMASPTHSSEEKEELEAERGDSEAAAAPPSVPVEPASQDVGRKAEAESAEESVAESESQPVSKEGPETARSSRDSAEDESEEETVPEEDVEAQIERFKEKKALRCPECGKSELKKNQTAAGKTFYSCTNPRCQFISWGPPVYIPCSRCKAAYTIEMREGEKRWLECLNSACGFKQLHPDDAPKKKRRVVRRRVVRRRKR